MLKSIPLLNEPPSEEYVELPKVWWFVNESNLIGKPVLYQLWENGSLTDGLPAQVWVRVPLCVRNNDVDKLEENEVQ
jgi:hypothetical protein